MSKTSIHVEGLDRVAHKLQDMQLWAAPLRKGLDKAGFIVESEAKRNAPVDRGTLRASITHEVEHATVPRFVKVGSKLGYAPMMEYGTGRAGDGPGGSTSHFPPPSALAGWAGRHGMPGAEFAIAAAIARRGGLKPRRYLRNAIESQEARVVAAIRSAMREVETNFGR